MMIPFSLDSSIANPKPSLTKKIAQTAMMILLACGVPIQVQAQQQATATPAVPQRIVIISLVGESFMQITRSLQPANFNSDSQRHAMVRDKAFAANEVESVKVSNKEERVAVAVFKNGADSLVESQFANAYRALRPDTMFGTLAKGKTELSQAAMGLPDAAAVTRVQANLKLIAEDAPADRYLLILPNSEQDWTRRMRIAGIGWVGNRGTAQTDVSGDKQAGQAAVTTFAFLRICEFDGKTFALLNHKALSVNRMLRKPAEAGLDPWTTYAEPQRVEALQQLLANAMPRVIGALLTPDSPEHIPPRANTR